MTATRYGLLFLAALGMGLCVAGGVGVWYVESRVNHARELVTERVGEGFTAIRERLVEVEDLAERSKITMAEVEARLRERAREVGTERLAANIDVEGRVEQLAAGLSKAEQVLAISRETVEHVRHALELGDALGFGWNASSVDPLLERLAELNGDLVRAMETADSLRQRLDEDLGEQSRAERWEQVATIAARLVATFGKVDARLATLQERLTDVEQSIRERSAKWHVRLIAAAVGATLFLLWMGAGQFCLWRWARRWKASG